MGYRKKRKKLVEFKEVCENYYSLTARHNLNEESNRQLKILRTLINQTIPVIIRYIRDVGGSTSFYSANFGGLSGEIDVFGNFFHPGIEDQKVLDLLDRAIGRYDYRISNQWKTWINPFHWIGEIIRIPFHILRFAGFDATKWEPSLLGKIYKAIVGFAILVKTLIEIYQFLRPYLAARGIIFS